MKNIKSYNIFKESINDIDLRRIDKTVLCIKNYKNKGVLIFKKGKHYSVNGFYGDPHAALDCGISDYLPVEFISLVTMVDDYDNLYNFKIKKLNSNNPKFFDYFDNPEYINNVDKYNL